jgi:hypothetical protein
MIRVAAFGLVAGNLGLANAASFLGPSPYVAFDDSVSGAGTAISPFAGSNFSYLYLETFEDHLLNTPGVSYSSPGAVLAVGVTSVVYGPSAHDSVDADDGVIDGSGLLGDSFFAYEGGYGIRFDFDSPTLGALPTHVGIVWTDGGGDIIFRAFGPGGALLGGIGPVSDASFPDASQEGETPEDRFFGVSDAGGISAIHIYNGVAAGIEVDHLQYGLVPEPNTALLVGASLLGLVALRRRK